MYNMNPESLRWLLALDDIQCRIRFSMEFNQFVREVDKAYPANRLTLPGMGDLYVRSIFEGFRRIQRP